MVDELILHNTKPRPSHEPFRLWALVKLSEHTTNIAKGTTDPGAECCWMLKKKLPKQALYLYFHIIVSLLLLHQDKALENSWTWQSRPCRACKIAWCKLNISDIPLITYHMIWMSFYVRATRYQWIDSSKYGRNICRFRWKFKHKVNSKVGSLHLTILKLATSSCCVFFDEDLWTYLYRASTSLLDNWVFF